MRIQVSGIVKLRPRNTDQPLREGGTTVFFDDEPMRPTVLVTFASMEERDAFDSAFARVVVQRQDDGGRWADVHTFVTDVNSASPVRDSRILAQPTRTLPVQSRPELDIPPRDNRPDIPQEPGGKPRPKIEPIVDNPATTVPGRAFEAPEQRLLAGTRAIRARAVRPDRTAVESQPVAVDVRRAPAVLTLLAMGGTCTDPDANTNHQNLTEAGISRNIAACEAKGVPATFLGDLTPMASVNCNDPCNAGCVNFLAHLAQRLMNRDLGTRFEGINNAGTRICERATNAEGVRNRVIFGKWRNTEEELVCGTEIKFNTIVDDFVGEGGKSVILIGQSQGGAKLAGMIRDHWRWGSNLTVELIALWDATSFDGPNGFDTGHFGIVSMGVRKVGNKPRKVLNFCQYSNAVPFQNGAPLDPSEAHADLEEHDLDGCFSHNGIARSQFVHHRTADVVQEALHAARDRARR
jgi:hypothetical protein